MSIQDSICANNMKLRRLKIEDGCPKLSSEFRKCPLKMNSLKWEQQEDKEETHDETNQKICEL